MNWISDWALPKIQGLFKRESPENLWHNCPACQQMIFHRDMEKALRVCSHCGHHMRLGAVQRLEATLDPGFSRIELPKAPADPLLDLHEALAPVLAHFVRQRAVEFVGGRALDRRIHERPDAIELRLVEPVEQLGELGLGLAREADDEIAG
jgi:hypothetical protein